MNLDTDLIRQFLLAHAETLVTWLVAGLVMMLLARFELRRAVRKSARAMSESVATTVAACVPDIAHAAAQATSGGAVAEPVESKRADALRHVALDTVAAVMARGRWLEELGNLRIPDDALLSGQRAAGADPLLVVAPQPVVQAYLFAQRTFEEEAARVQDSRRDALRRQDALRALEAEAAHVEQETASIVMRFEQANARSAQREEAGDHQRFLIQKYNALGQREKEIVQQRGILREQAQGSADDLAFQARDAALRYREALAPLMQQLREAWGHGDAPDVFDTWLSIDPMHPETERDAA